MQFYAFDILASDADRLPLSMRKASLARLLARRVDGIFLSDFEQGKIGPDLFRPACLMGLEGMVSTHRDRPFAALGQGQEPQACVQPGSGSVRLSRRRAGRRRSRLSVIGSPPLPLLTPYGSRLRAGIFLEVWKTLARLSARRRPASYGRGITLSRARQNEVRAPQPEGGHR